MRLSLFKSPTCGIRATTFLMLFTAGVLWSQPKVISDRIGAPTEEPSPLTPEQTAAVEAGIRLHDAGDFAGAILKYQAVLDENPRAVRALYEMGLSYLSSKDRARSTEITLKGVRYKSDWLAAFYNLLAIAYEERGEPDRAIAVYQEGLEYTAGSPLIRFNLAITELKGGRVEQAKADLKQVLLTNPNHASSHLSLADLYVKADERIPALLANLRFLLIEPRSARSPGALQVVRSIWRSYAPRVVKSGGGMEVSITHEPKSLEGDFDRIGTTAQVISPLKDMASSVAGPKSSTEFDLLVLQYGGVFAEMVDPAKRGKGFVAEYYEPFFGQIKQKEYVAPFVAVIHQSAPPPGWREWVTANRPKVNEFAAWMKSYDWPKKTGQPDAPQ